MRGDDHQQRSAWSLFLPVALAVLVGGVLAGLVLRAIDSGSGKESDAAATQRDGDALAPVADPAPEVAVAAVRPEPTAQLVPSPQREPEPDPEPELHEAAPAPAAAPQFAAAQPAVPVLPGPILARRDGAPAACINGTIALRDENGWQQQLENDAPVPCVEGSPAAP